MLFAFELLAVSQVMQLSIVRVTTEGYGSRKTHMVLAQLLAGMEISNPTEAVGHAPYEVCSCVLRSDSFGREPSKVSEPDQAYVEY